MTLPALLEADLLYQLRRHCLGQRQQIILIGSTSTILREIEILFIPFFWLFHSRHWTMTTPLSELERFGNYDTDQILGGVLN